MFARSALLSTSVSRGYFTDLGWTWKSRCRREEAREEEEEAGVWANGRVAAVRHPRPLALASLSGLKRCIIKTERMEEKKKERARTSGAFVKKGE